ncbi:hypothetical protein D0N43_08930 [Klebsiella aerogenes]|uniref:Uncharacterized protein n=1 Tax=Klebsiella aerogenes (strain ATCC 13048 / DSM 30053 / CCUG 1429 / JCM 1235 / KCTC 2190 / NBRC 13534 / NCIMB 10102 / NCTC 10006 / CDC 819-56) TaxID=1028307 RepID=A0A0H3FYJ8_KLEAK|nr:hypothetical protein EAE_23545 [Klebsiella aerogenes KCTC 2190]QEU17621.1 hypothetical protein FOB49_02790 [Klebsiella aerogenes]QHJ52005.1 hypothetical protein GUU79_12905 [Klebsiella aerogenes]RFP74894.1 hypothetical protein D0N43_08930 [Klebsiella aerogenes]
MLKNVMLMDEYAHREIMDKIQGKRDVSSEDEA